MQGGGGISSLAIEKGVWQPWDLFPRYSCRLPNAEYKSCLAARPMKQRCGVFCGEVPRSYSLQYLACCYFGLGRVKCIGNMLFVK